MSRLQVLQALADLLAIDTLLAALGATALLDAMLSEAASATALEALLAALTAAALLDALLPALTAAALLDALLTALTTSALLEAVLAALTAAALLEALLPALTAAALLEALLAEAASAATLEALLTATLLHALLQRRLLVGGQVLEALAQLLAVALGSGALTRAGILLAEAVPHAIRALLGGLGDGRGLGDRLVLDDDRSLLGQGGQGQDGGGEQGEDELHGRSPVRGLVTARTTCLPGTGSCPTPRNPTAVHARYRKRRRATS